MNDLSLSIRQLTEAWRAMCMPAAGSSSASANGVEYVFSGLPIPFFNVSIPTGGGISAEQLAAIGKESCAWAAPRGVPWMLVVTHECLAPGVDAIQTLDGCGMMPLMPLTGMLAEKVAPLAKLPEGLQVRVPDDEAGCHAVLDVNGAAYGMPLDEAHGAMDLAFWRNHFPVVGSVGTEPVSCTAVLMVEGYRYVALVATAPGKQRRGYADAAMRHALQVAAEAHGESPTVLHATAAGKPVYERMGYRSISTHTIFLEKKFLGEH